MHATTTTAAITDLTDERQRISSFLEIAGEVDSNVLALFALCPVLPGMWLEFARRDLQQLETI
jgi:hypothetical protein